MQHGHPSSHDDTGKEGHPSSHHHTGQEGHPSSHHDTGNEGHPSSHYDTGQEGHHDTSRVITIQGKRVIPRGHHIFNLSVERLKSDVFLKRLMNKYM